MSSGEQNGKGMVLAAAGFGAFSCADALVKLLGQSYPSIQINFLMCVFAILALLPVASRLGGLKNTLRTRRPFLHAFRGVVLGLVTLIVFYAFAHLQLAAVYTLLFTAPLFATLISIPLFREKVGKHRWSAMIVGFTGVVIAMRPGEGGFDPLMLIVVLAAFGFASAMVSTRLFGEDETQLSFALYPAIYQGLIALVLTIPVWITPSAIHLALFIGAGVLEAAGLLCVGLAFRVAASSVVSQFHYTQMVWGLVFGFVLFGDIPGASLLAGAVVIIGSGLYLIYREKKVGSTLAHPPSETP